MTARHLSHRRGAAPGRGSRTWTWWRSRRLADPPVCRLMDYGKFKYQEQKKAHEAKLKQKQIQVKEVKFRPGTDEGDYKIKLRNLIAVPRGRRQGQGHAALPRPRDGAPGNRRCALLERVRDDLDARRRGRAVSQAGRPADDHGAGAEEEGQPPAPKATAPKAGFGTSRSPASEGCSEARRRKRAGHK